MRLSPAAERRGIQPRVRPAVDGVVDGDVPAVAAGGPERAHPALVVAHAPTPLPCTRPAGDVDGRGDVAVGREEQGAADDEAAHGGQVERAAPRRVRVLRVALGIAAEQQRRQRRRVHDAVELVDDGQLEPRVGARGAEPGGDVDRLDRRVGVELVDDPAALARREERLDHRHDLVLGELGDGLRARLERRDRAGVVEADAGQHLAAVDARAPRSRPAV